MVIAIGTDLAEVERIRQNIQRFGQRFVDRLFTEAEQAYSANKANWAERYAARFAAKEAGMKAIGTGCTQGVSWKQFEITNDPAGKPILHLSGKALAIADSLGVRRIHVSLTHTSELAVAVVVLEDGT